MANPSVPAYSVIKANIRPRLTPTELYIKLAKSAEKVYSGDWLTTKSKVQIGKWFYQELGISYTELDNEYTIKEIQEIMESQQ